jgi:thiol:disulfide interchange protein DsbA
MSMTRRRFHQCLLGAIAASVVAPSALADDLVEGRDWRAVNPAQPTDEPGKIEVLEFFSYGCPHCGKLNPLIQEWKPTLPEDVAFQRVPVTFGRAAWANLARAFYALEYSGQLDLVDQALFDAIGHQRKQLFTKDAMMDWLQTRELDTTEFSKQFDGFAVETRLARGHMLAERYQVNSVPLIIVAGRYAVLGEGGKSYADLLRIADGLIVKAREAA